MNDQSNSRQKGKRAAKPLDEARLRDLALAYVARFSTSSAKLASYLKRKLRERGWAGEADPDVDALCQRYVELGYIDDALYAKTRASGLLGRGYGPRRVAQTLYADGIGESLRNDLDPDEAQRRLAVQTLARKRRFGPYFQGELLPDRRDKQIAALLRAGHGFDHVRSVMDAPSEEALDQWVDDAMLSARDGE